MSGTAPWPTVVLRLLRVESLQRSAPQRPLRHRRQPSVILISRPDAITLTSPSTDSFISPRLLRYHLDRGSHAEQAVQEVGAFNWVFPGRARCQRKFDRL